MNRVGIPREVDGDHPPARLGTASMTCSTDRTVTHGG